MSKKVITVAITTVALTLGGIGLSTAASAKSNSKVKVAVSKTVTKPSAANLGTLRKGGPEAEVATVLADLVTKGTITQAQADAITAALVATHPAGNPMGPRTGGPLGTNRGAEKTLIASTLGIDVATLQTRLAAGDSLATIAGTKTPTLIAALVADVTKKIDAAVTAGQLTPAQATTMKTNLTAQVTAEVNAVRGQGGMMGGRGMGGHMGDADGGQGMMGGTTPPTIPGVQG